MWPLLVTNSKEMRVLSYGLMQFQTENGSSYELIMAASCTLVLPIVVVYLILRKYVIEGVTPVSYTHLDVYKSQDGQSLTV